MNFKKLITAGIFTATIAFSAEVQAENKDMDIYVETLAELQETSQQYEVTEETAGEEVFQTIKTDETVYTTARLNLRQEPSLEALILTTADFGAEVRRIGICSNNWCKVEYILPDENGNANAVVAYMYSDYLSYEKPQPVKKQPEKRQEKSVELSSQKSEAIETNNQIKIGKELLGKFKLTAYCGCSQCCGTAGNPTASGSMPGEGRTVAMAGIPFGTKVEINGQTYVVEDRGTPYGHFDIYFNSHTEARNFGVQYANVYIVK